MRIRILASVFVVAGVLAPSAVFARPACLRGTIWNGTQKASTARVKLVSQASETMTTADGDGAYKLCVEPGTYQLRVYWGNDVREVPSFQVVKDDEGVDIHLESLPRVH
jgi:hypothetical protein